MVNMITLKTHEEWLQHRKKYIGGSDCAALLGLNQYKNNVQLFEEKLGIREVEDISEKEFVKYGTDAEQHLRALFALDFPQYQVDYVENNSFLNSKYPFAAASLDGILTDAKGRKGILEIKTSNIMQSAQREKWNDIIPDNYYCQVLHYLLVTEFEFVVLKAQLKARYKDEIYLTTKHYFFERKDHEASIAYLLKKETAFYENLKAGIKPNLVLPEF